MGAISSEGSINSSSDKNHVALPAGLSVLALPGFCTAADSRNQARSADRADMEALRRDDRTKRLSVLARTVEAGNYQVPAEYVADAIIYSSSRRSFDPFRQSE